MIHFSEHRKIDKAKWDVCIDESHNGLIYAYSWYLDVVCPGWNALIEDDYISVMPLTAGRKYGIDYLYPPYFAQQLGVFSKKNLSEKKAEEFLVSIPGKYKLIEINLNSGNNFSFPGFSAKKNVNFELNLNSSYETLQHNFSDDAKRNLKKAAKHPFIVNKSTPAEKIIKLFIENTGKKIPLLKKSNYNTLYRLIETCISKNIAETWGVFSGKELYAGTVWFFAKNRAIYFFSAASEAGKKKGAVYFLIDSFIRQNAGTKKVLDFEGSNLKGVAGFYRGFAPAENVYLQIKKNKLPSFIRWVSRK